MAPEQWDDGPIDARTDVYAVGVLGWLLVTGENPFAGLPVGELVLRQKRGPSTPGDRRMSPGYREVIARALAPHPNARFESAAQMRAALRELCSEQTPAAGTVHTRDLVQHPIAVTEGGRTHRLRCIDLSRAGAYVSCADRLPARRTQVAVSITLAGGELPARAEVVRVVPPELARAWKLPPGFALQFLEPPRPFGEVGPAASGTIQDAGQPHVPGQRGRRRGAAPARAGVPAQRRSVRAAGRGERRGVPGDPPQVAAARRRTAVAGARTPDAGLARSAAAAAGKGATRPLDPGRSLPARRARREQGQRPRGGALHRRRPHRVRNEPAPCRLPRRSPAPRSARTGVPDRRRPPRLPRRTGRRVARVREGADAGPAQPRGAARVPGAPPHPGDGLKRPALDRQQSGILTTQPVRRVWGTAPVPGGGKSFCRRPRKLSVLPATQSEKRRKFKGITMAHRWQAVGPDCDAPA
ncbi:MAG: PilZ domain-containing protein [Myxococcaceae bacterium]|nr:PilZ domain-containing protein [Myxococcaceae bacterium]